jgi:hypothetical protein
MKTMRHNTLIQWPALLALLAVLLGWASGAEAGTLTSGISGQTLVHDGFAVKVFAGQMGSTNTPRIVGSAGSIDPFRASLRVYSVGSGRLVTTITTGAEGRFRVRLRPGFYRVVPDTMWHGQVLRADAVIGRYEVARATTVRVRPHRFVPLTITYERVMGL